MTRNPVRDLLVLCALLWTPAALAADSFTAEALDLDAFRGKPPTRETRLFVDCDRGRTLARAVAVRAEVLVVEFSGTCTEELVITRDRLTLRGRDDSAVLTDDPATDGAVPLLLLQGADVVLEDFTVQGSSGRGLRIQRSSGVQMINMAVIDNGNSGLTIEESSSVHVIDSAFTGNGFAGISAWGNSNLALTGSLDVSSNGVAGALLTGSTFSNRGGGTISAHDVFFGVGTQHGGSGIFPPVEASNNEAGAFAFGASYLGAVTVEDSTFGLLVSNRGTFDGPVNISALTEGVRIIDGSTVFLRSGSIAGPLAVRGFPNSVLETVNVTFDGDLRFEFGNHAYFAGSTATGTVFCDPTALVGGTLSCDAPLPASLRTTADAAADVIGRLPLVEPDRLP